MSNGKIIYTKTDEATINAELIAAQGSPVDIGGYYLPNKERVVEAMRPSVTLNRIINTI